MAATVPLTQHRSTRWSPRRPSPRIVGALCAAILLVLSGDALVRDYGAFDYRLIDAIQRLDLPYLGALLRAVSRLTSSPWAIFAWGVALAGFAVVRFWSAAVALFFVPVGVAVNNLILSGLIIDRPRPSADHLRRLTGETSPTSFPSGQVVGAVLLYGLILVAARRVARRPVRLALQGIAVVVIGLVGLARVWEGAHWPTDVLAGYALGGLMLAGLLAVYLPLERAVAGLPLLHAGPIPHDERQPHAHALTSTILFRGDTVAKLYNPGFVPRAIYWLAFQAPFAYERNRDALRAAVLRRNLAGLLTEHWYGDNRVARAVGIERVAGRDALIGAFVPGTAPRDHRAARRFLRDLADRFDEAGLPTWQIDPRQPRALGNILERPDGAYAVIDLESGLVSPLASPRAWGRALGRGLVPVYDDVYVDLARAYVAREAAAMRAAHGDAWVAELCATLDACDAATAAWHAGEPRIWSRLVVGVRSGFGVRAWPDRLRARAAGGEDLVSAWLEMTVARWEAEGRVTPVEASTLRTQIEAPQFQAVLPHFGVFLMIGVALRFPLGSIARVSYLLANQAMVTARLLTGRIDRARWRRTMSVHSPLVLLFAAIPDIGTFAYLASGPVRSNRLLVRVALDTVLVKLPWHVYERTGLRRVIARPAATAKEAPDGRTASH